MIFSEGNDTNMVFFLFNGDLNMNHYLSLIGWGCTIKSGEVRVRGWDFTMKTIEFSMPNVGLSNQK